MACVSAGVVRVRVRVRALLGHAYLAAVHHGAHHALGEVEARQVRLRHQASALAEVLGPLNVLEQAGERCGALGLVQAVVGGIAAVVKLPRLQRARGIGNRGRARRAVQAGRALERGRLLAEAAPGGEHLLHDAREGGVLGARAVQDAADEEEDERDARDEEPRQAVGRAATPSENHGPGALQRREPWRAMAHVSR